MFFVKGWVPLREVSLAVSRRHARDYNEWLKQNPAAAAKGASDYENATDLAERHMQMEGEIYEICMNAKQVGVLLSNGNVVCGSRELVKDEIFSGSQSPGNSHVDLFVGTVGSGLLLDNLGNPINLPNEQYMRVKYGPFYGLPVLLSDECLDKARAGGSNSSQTELEQSPKAISQGIVRLFDADSKHTRSEYKEILAPDTSVRQFQSAWEMARAERPELSKPGRRSPDEQ